MIEKKDFIIPENVEEGVKLLGDVKVKELIKTLAPSLLLSIGTYYLPLNPIVKLAIIAALFIIPGYLILDRPVRRNIPVMYHVKAYFKFMLRQKDFSYKKERYHVEAISENEDKGTETKANSAKFNTDQGNRWRVFNHSK
ncbi:hypothetical protein V7158_01965 [Priestia megaterium]|uniref:hypothetical protein n=1 Tax=Priestia megaterium TaxID=1404 RepID=UPI002FFE13EF